MELELDTKGLNCPLPVLKAKKAMKQIEKGSTLKIFATDPASVIDFNHFCHTAGHKLLESNNSQGVYTYIIKKGG